MAGDGRVVEMEVVYSDTVDKMVPKYQKMARVRPCCPTSSATLCWCRFRDVSHLKAKAYYCLYSILSSLLKFVFLVLSYITGDRSCRHEDYTTVYTHKHIHSHAHTHTHTYTHSHTHTHTHIHTHTHCRCIYH